MRRPFVLAALALAGASIVASPPSAASTTSARASIEVVSVQPLRIAGTGFRAYERVRLTTWVNESRTVARTRAGRRGAFRLRIAGVAIGPCGSLTVRAVGNRGSRSTAALDYLMCAPTG